jgi:predicted AlkP superfamily pyrophosphatase or phosphodiesterase
MRHAPTRHVLSLLFSVLALATAGAARAAPVLMISIDGLRPADVLEADARGLKIPTLRGLVRHGAYATAVRDALPSVTYPNHTTLVTGVWPARHGIASNVTFDPLRKNAEGWFWYAPDIKVPTLWDAVHAAGRTTASVGWPVTVDNPAIDANIPEYWRAKVPEDAKLQAALSTPGLAQAIAARTGLPLGQVLDMGTTEPANDEIKGRIAEAIYALKKPAFFTLHLSSLDHYEHLYGPGSDKAHEALERTDAAVGSLIAAARKAEPDLVVFVVSDHGFAPVEHDINIFVPFVEAGLIQLDAAGKVTSWEAAPWVSGGSAAVVLARKDDAALRAKVSDLLARLAADPQSGVGQVLDRAGVQAMGGNADADFFVDAKIGYEMETRLKGPLVATPGSNKGMHGYFPDHPEMRATLIIDGPGLAKHGPLGEVDMRDIAPTVAEVMKIGLPSAAGRPLF